MSDKPYNPWRVFIENCINGDNYFRDNEYRDLLHDLDYGYSAKRELDAYKEVMLRLHRELSNGGSTGIAVAGVIDQINLGVAELLKEQIP